MNVHALPSEFFKASFGVLAANLNGEFCEFFWPTLAAAEALALQLEDFVKERLNERVIFR